MKRITFSLAALCLVVALTGGCALDLSSAPKQSIVHPTVGQQLIDLQKAKDAGAITDAEFQTQKAKLLGNK